MAYGDDKSPGARAAERGDPGGIKTTSIAGRTVYSGSMVDQTLQGAGAIAGVTEVDGQKHTMVGSGFDQNNLQHQRTLFHEWGHEYLGMDEDQAKSFESVMMTVQQADTNFTIEKGIDMMGKMKGVAADQMQGEAMAKISQAFQLPQEDAANPMDGYFGMLAQGMQHEEITQELARKGLDALDKSETDRQFRTGEGQG